MWYLCKEHRELLWGITRASKSTLGISHSMLDAEDSSDDSIGPETVLAEDSFHEEPRSGEKGVEETGMMIQQEDLKTIQQRDLVQKLEMTLSPIHLL